MKISNITKLNLDDFYWTFRFGKSKKNATIFDLRANNFADLKEPVFFLSTGRCGTKWVSKLLSNDKNVKVEHSPNPSFAVQSRFVYELFKANNHNLSPNETKLIEEIFLTGREQFLRYSVKSEKRYFETNNYITFFAPVIAKLIPNSKFVHIYRHPGEFVRSGIRRNYYKKYRNDEIKRIVPLTETEKTNWKSYSKIEKVSWLWNETNSFIEDFKKSIPDERIYTFNFNDLTVENCNKLLDFLEVNINQKTIEKSLSAKENVQKSGTYKHYEDWSSNQKNELMSICDGLGSLYRYKL
ncbi:MAG: hypothetical protein HN704_02300 [Bacteroidetes bacterium]|nr:hypothetical protein [Bacteroidota bacterium]MBT6687357.1 hypothetical protein [Bacteroidota bacterium]MBT7144609.1 hypothetical protein [Bacteroidota bacterium]MBT7490417.1 hypothetical protein [Bacteroidota bacterium]